MNQIQVISYSQCEEDLYIMNTFFTDDKGPKRNGIYLELGALDGVLYSNTKMFQDFFDWRGILIEPHPIQYRFIIKNRPNNFIFNDLVSNSTEELKFRYFEDFHSAVSGVENTLPSTHFSNFFNNVENINLKQNTIMKTPKPLTQIIKSCHMSYIDFMSLDVEGHEYEVLMSWDFSVPIHVIMIEMLGVNTEKEQLCRYLLLDHGYVFHSTFKHNEIFVLPYFLYKS
jgi:FkbM family methyltransferase